MIGFLRQANTFTNRHAGKLFLAGLAGIVFYNWRLWVGDKALLAQKAQPEPLPPLENWPNLPMVSVLVAAWNEAAYIEQHIESFLNLRYPHIELVLCAGGQDGTYRLASHYAGDQVVMLNQLPGEGKQRALQRCFPKSTGEIIYLTDADCLLDDNSFEQVVFPIASGEEEAVSGSSRPSPGELSRPFIASQAASQTYSAMHTPEYAPGLLGRNCAIQHDLLLRSHGLEVTAPSGTDYVLAKMLTQAGARIRQVPHSMVTTHHPSTPAAYLRQQHRWLHNVSLYGQRFGAMDEVRAAWKTSLTGLAMLLLPLSIFFVWWMGLVVWLLLFSHAWFSRLRYLRYSSNLLGSPISLMVILMQPVILLLDFIAWVSPIIDNVFPGKANKW